MAKERPPSSRHWRVVEAVNRPDLACTLCGRRGRGGWLFRWHQLYLCDDRCAGIAIQRYRRLFARG
jgi:hypothetical protein